MRRGILALFLVVFQLLMFQLPALATKYGITPEEFQEYEGYYYKITAESSGITNKGLLNLQYSSGKMPTNGTVQVLLNGDHVYLYSDQTMNADNRIGVTYRYGAGQNSFNLWFYIEGEEDGTEIAVFHKKEGYSDRLPYWTIEVESLNPADLTLSNITLPKAVPDEGGNYSLRVKNSGEENLEWNTENLPVWLSLSPKSGTVRGGGYKTVDVVVDANMTVSSKQRDVKFFNVNDSADYQYLSVEQEGKNSTQNPADLRLSRTSLGYSADGANKNITIYNDGDKTLYWRAEDIPSWLSISRPDGWINGKDRQTITLSAAENTTSGERTSDIVFRNNDNSSDYSQLNITQAGQETADNKEPIVKIRQPAPNQKYFVDPAITLSGTAYDFDGDITHIAIWVNGRQMSVNPGLQWEKEVIFQEGENKIVVQATDDKGAKDTDFVVAFYSEKSAAPVLNFAPGWKTSKPSPGQEYEIQLVADDPDGNLDRIEVDWTGKGNEDNAVVAYNANGKEGQVMALSRDWQSTRVRLSATAYDETGERSNMVQLYYPVSGINGKKVAAARDWNNQGGTCMEVENKKADPIDLPSGAQILSHDLLTVNGVIPISFGLIYHSLVLEDSTVGVGWGHNFGYNARLENLENGDVEIHWSNNRVNSFLRNADGSFFSPDIVTQNDRLVQNHDGGFTLTRKDMNIYRFDTAGRLVELENAVGQKLLFVYRSGRLSTISEPVSGVYLDYTYDGQGRLVTVTDPMNRIIRLGYNNKNHLISITDADGQTTRYTYNDKGQVISGVNADGEQLFRSTYDAEGRVVQQDDGLDSTPLTRLSYDEETEPGKVITTVTDRNGNERIYVFNDRQQMLSITDELGNIAATYTYDERGNRISATDANGHTTRFEYNAHGNIISVTDPANGVTRMTYDDLNNLKTVENALGKITRYTYDANNQLVGAQNAAGNLTQFTYNANGQVQTVQTPEGNVSRYEYVQGMLARIISPENSQTRYGYDAAGRLTSVMDADGNVWTMSYDEACGSSCRVETVTDPLNNTVIRRYDSRGNLLSITDARGNKTRFEYDAEGRRTLTVDAMGNETRYEHNGEGRLIGVVNARGNESRLAYDAKGRLVGVTNPMGETRGIEYDAAQNVTARYDAYGKKVLSLVYDQLDRVRSATDIPGRTVKYHYDALGRLTTTMDALNRKTSFNYDDLNRLIGATDALNGNSSQSFDKDGNRTGLTDPNGNTTQFTHDRSGRLTAEIVATGDRVTYTYNARDLVETLTNGRNQVRRFEYDKLGRVVRFADPDGEVSYTYDENGNVLTVTDAEGTIERRYDALNRVTWYRDARGNVIEYDYDSVGNLVRLTYPDGRAVQYAYDDADRLISVTDWNGRETRYGYDKNGRLVRTERPNGTVRTRYYDNYGQLIQQSDVKADGELIIRYDYNYDAAGNIIEEKVTPEPEPFTISPVTMTYGKANRLATYNGKEVRFDADGNMVRGPLNGEFADLVFDSRNRLKSAGRTVYVYDAENHRVGFSETWAEIRFIVNPNAYLSQVLVKIGPDGEETFYMYGLGLIGREKDGEYLDFHYDLRGSTVALSDEDGQVTDRFYYSPFAKITARTGTNDTTFLYNGRDGVMGDENGLYYMRARYYSPYMRRFVSQDVLIGKISNGQSLNRNAFVNGKPISFVDPFGLSKSEAENPEKAIDWVGRTQHGFSIKSKLIENGIKNADEVKIFKRLSGVQGGMFSVGKIAAAEDKWKQTAIEAASLTGGILCSASVVGSVVCAELAGQAVGLLWSIPGNMRKSSRSLNVTFSAIETCHNRSVQARIDNEGAYNFYVQCINEEARYSNVQIWNTKDAHDVADCLLNGNNPCLDSFGYYSGPPVYNCY